MPLVSLKFDETMTSPKLFKKDVMQKPFLYGAEWRLFQRCSISLVRSKKGAKLVPCKYTGIVTVVTHTTVAWKVLMAYITP